MMRYVLLIVPLVAVPAIAQKKPLPASDRTVTVEHQPATAALPSFDLPEFVITGRESIDLPSAEKRTLADDVGGGTITRPISTVMERRTPVVTEGDAPHGITHEPVPHVMRAHLGVGSFSTLDVGVQGSGTVEDVHLQADAMYRSTAGFEPNARMDRMRVNAGARVPTSFLEGMMTGERVGFSAGYSRHGYRWYGSDTPAADRRVTAGFGTIDLTGVVSEEYRAALALFYGGGAIADTSSSVTESTIGLTGKLGGSIAGIPADAHVALRNSGKSGGSGGSYGGIDAGVRLHWSPFDMLNTSFAAGIASVSGEAGQKSTMFLPGFEASFAITPRHTFVGTYAPQVRMHDMMALVSSTPFMDASTPVRHALVRNRGSIGVESHWSGLLRSSIALESSRWGDYPVAADTGRKGFFKLFYGDITETLLRISVVATLPVNHYFSAIAIVRSSKSSASGLSVPYLPSSELRMRYRNTLTERLEVEGVAQLVSARQISMTGTTVTIPGYARMDVKVTFLVLPGLRARAEARNLLDERIEHWAGYQESPFALTIGLSYAL